MQNSIPQIENVDEYDTKIWSNINQNILRTADDIKESEIVFSVDMTNNGARIKKTPREGAFSFLL